MSALVRVKPAIIFLFGWSRVMPRLVLYSASILFVWLNYPQHAFEWLPYKNYVWA